MVLGHGVVGIAHIGQGSLQVTVYFLIVLGHGAALVGHADLLLRLLDVGHAQVLCAGLIVVGHGEHVDEQEVVVGAAEQSLGTCLTQFVGCGTACLVDGLQGGIGTGDGSVAGLIEALGRLVVALGHVLPGVDLVGETISVGVVHTVVVHIVRHILVYEYVGVLRIGRGKELNDLFLGIDGGSVVGHLVEEVVARGECHRAHRQGQNRIF